MERETKPVNPFFHQFDFQFDLFETIFFHISRYEEVFCRDENKNPNGWLKEELQFLVINNLEKIPVVDQLVLAFFEILLDRKIQKATTFDLSHDIDVLYRFKPYYKFFRSLAAIIYHRKVQEQFLSSILHFSKMLSGKKSDPYDTYHWLLRSENCFSAKRLYLMSGGNTKLDNHYRIESRKVRAIIDQALEKGYEIGLHPSYNAGFDERMYNHEKTKLEKILNQEIVYNRQHWLRFSWSITPKIYLENRIEEDSSIGFTRRIGFRTGTGFPFYLYDFDHEKAFSWKERPLILMESCLIHESRQSGIAISDILSSFLMRNQKNTNISLNFHNSNFDPTLKTGLELQLFYAKFIGNPSDYVTQLINVS